MGERIYAYCSRCGSIVYRIRGFQHGDGQIDSNDKPVWLLVSENEQEGMAWLLRELKLNLKAIPRIKHCGCCN